MGLKPWADGAKPKGLGNDSRVVYDCAAFAKSARPFTTMQIIRPAIFGNSGYFFYAHLGICYNAIWRSLIASRPIVYGEGKQFASMHRIQF